jgi:pyruvate,water dikinase
VTPLTFSLLADAMSENLAQRRLARAGLVDASQQPVFRLIDGHVYVNASLVAMAMREVPGAFLSEGLLALLPDGLRKEVEEHTRGLLDLRTLRTVQHLFLHERAWAPWSRAAMFAEECSAVTRDFSAYRVSGEWSGSEIVQRMEDVRQRLGRFLEVVSWGVLYAYVFFHLTANLVRRWAPEEGEVTGKLVQGIPGIRTFEVHEEMMRLAAALRSDPPLRATVLSETPAVIAERSARGELGRFGAEIERLRRVHGHRLIARDLVHPTWRERPAVLVEIVRRLAWSVESLDGRSEPTNGQTLERVRARVSLGVTGRVRWEVFRVVLALCRQYYAVRENMRYHADYFLAALRGLALAAGSRLADRGALFSPDDVFYLTADELYGVLREDIDGGVSREAADRRERYAGYRERVPPEVVWEGEANAASGVDASRSTKHEARSELRGVGAAPGWVEGNARVIRSAEDLDRLCNGEVVIAAATDPTWTSYLALASGLVLEAGGLLSHGAIIARELGIPAVVDVGQATRMLRTGERVVLDGSAGTVAVVS